MASDVRELCGWRLKRRVLDEKDWQESNCRIITQSEAVRIANFDDILCRWSSGGVESIGSLISNENGDGCQWNKVQLFVDCASWCVFFENDACAFLSGWLLDLVMSHSEYRKTAHYSQVFVRCQSQIGTLFSRVFSNFLCHFYLVGVTVLDPIYKNLYIYSHILSTK